MLASEFHNDDEWELLRKGDQGALLAIYQQHYIGLMNYGATLWRDKDRVNDCFIKILLKLWDDRDRLPEVKNVRYYLLTCLRREIIHELKSDMRWRAMSVNGDSETTVELSYEEILIHLQGNHEIKRQLLAALQQLTSREKQLLQWRFYEGLSYEEIAEKANITKRTAYNIIHAALKQLKKDFKKSSITVAEFYPLLLVLLSAGLS